MFGGRVKELRKNLRLSQKEVSDSLHISQTTVSERELVLKIAQ